MSVRAWRRASSVVAGVTLLLSGWSGVGAQQVSSAESGAVAPLQLVSPPFFDSAVASGTRSRTGAPGPRYWQNSADYEITAQITPADSLLRGSERITYHNNSPQPLRIVVIRLYQNLMSAYGAKEGPAPAVTQGMVVEELRANGSAVVVPRAPAFEVRGDSMAARIYGTLMMVRLATPIAPGGTGTFDVRWHFTIPGAWAPRMGMEDATTGQIAQWYPQIGVYDDLKGWDLQLYTGTGEFYLDYGRFRYSVTLPAGFIVGGTGTLQNPQDVLTAAEIAALKKASATKDVVHVVTQADFGPGKATKGAAGSTLTWTYAADSVRDVAFSFGDHYLWDATSAVVDSATKRRSAVHVFYRPGAAMFDRVWKMAQSALEVHSARMVPYPYPQLTETEGGSGGMEYPMTVFVEAYPGYYEEDEVSAHEIGHEWFPMLVGSDETRYGWQDEGMNTFDTFFATDAFIPDSVGRGLADNQKQYAMFARSSDEPLVMMAPANAFGVTANSGYGIEAYAKPAVVLWALRATLGDDLFYQAYRAYIRDWAFKHPTPYDFFNTFNAVTKQDLDPFWFQWFFTNQRLDQAVVAVTQEGNRVNVTVRNAGQVYAPVDVTARTADGKKVTWREPMSAWYDGRQTVTTSHEVPGTVTEVVLDQAKNFPDIERGNNDWKK